MIIKPTNKIYVNKSPIHGNGVFASQPIKKGEVIEVCPVIDIEFKEGEISDILINYRFNWPHGTKPEKQVIPTGYGMIYNHSNTPNANWTTKYSDNCFEFFAVKDIEIDEEICTYYGDESYWNYGRTNTKVI